jgi:hypothetical protein
MLSPLEPDPLHPNLPEITSTTLPLLSTVLAGFAMTIIASLFLQTNVSNIWPLPNPFWGLVLLGVSTPFYLTSAIFGVQAQGFSYLNLTLDVQKFLKLKDPKINMDDYISTIFKKWRLWYDAAKLAFYLGLFTFVVGAGFLIWNYIGLVGALIFLAIIILVIIWGIQLKVKEHKIS